MRPVRARPVRWLRCLRGRGRLLRACLKQALAGTGGTSLVRGRPSPLLGFLFSLLPGAGHMYMGFMRRGLHLMALFFAAIWLSTLTGPFGLPELFSLLAAPVIWFYSFFDALGLSGRLRQGEAVPDRGLIAGDGEVPPAAWGWVLIGTGALLLLGNFAAALPSPVLFWMRRTVPPVTLIALGVLILWREGRRRRR